MVDIQRQVDNLRQKEIVDEEIRKLASIFSASGDLVDEENYLLKKIELIELRKNKPTRSKSISAEELIEDVENRPTIARYATGIDALDNKLNGGIEIGSFVQLAGASFAGKTHLAIEILSTIANREKVLFFNFEMGDRRIAQRFSKSLDTEQARKNMMIHNDNRELSHIVEEIKHSYKTGIKFFAIDSKMKIEVSSEKDDYKKFSKISATLSKLTQENEIIIFLINQISEDDDKTGRLAFKGSGDQLYDTDLALFYMMDKKDLTYRNLQCRKNRQDENNFSLRLTLNGQGKTISVDGFETTYENNKGVAVSRQSAYNKNPSYESTYEMGVI